MTGLHPPLEIEVGGRSATARDKADLIDVYRDAYEDKLSDPFLSDQRHWERIEGYASAKGYALVEGRITGYLVGYALGYRLPENATWWKGLTTPVDPSLIAEDGTRTFAVTYMMVRQKYRRRGYAKVLHDQLLEARPERRAALLVNPSNVAARTAYETWGWRKIGELQPFADAPVYDAMLKDLAPALKPR
ncbi:GNAT family N-acetyltransferase [Actinoplanes sp. NBC_00393]|uniref:GNAT family N-acetyltransferase n=1 Tax=Actinoplanes sp. NBC_00393 TaxID=2975953 RepID=UPI002E248352